MNKTDLHCVLSKVLANLLKNNTVQYNAIIHLSIKVIQWHLAPMNPLIAASDVWDSTLQLVVLQIYDSLLFRIDYPKDKKQLHM